MAKLKIITSPFDGAVRFMNTQAAGLQALSCTFDGEECEGEILGERDGVTIIAAYGKFYGVPTRCVKKVEEK